MSSIEFHEMLKTAKKNAILSAQASSSSSASQVVLTNHAVNSLKAVATINTILYASSYLTADFSSFLLKKIETITDWHQVGGRQVALFGGESCLFSSLHSHQISQQSKYSKFRNTVGVPHPSGAICEPLPSWLNPVAQLLRPHFGDRPPDQVLLNRYLPGQGIEFHNDGPLYEPIAAILSFGADDVIRFRNTADHTISKSSSTTTLQSSDSVQGSGILAADEIKVFLPRNSLLVFSDLAYSDYLHGIIGDATHTPAAATQSSSEISTVRLSECCNAHLIDSKSHVDQSISACCEDSIPRRSSVRYSLTFRRLKHVTRPADEFGPCSAEERAEVLRRKLWWLKSISDA